MGKALSYIGGALLVLLSALLLVPMAVDWNTYRGAFEEEASRALGREVRVGGGVNLRLLPTPYVRFEKVRIADTAGTLGEPFFRAESFTMGLAVAPLLRGALEATHVELRQPVLALAIDAEGRGNWRDVALQPTALSLLPSEVRLNAVDIIDGTLAIKGGDGELMRLTSVSGEFAADSLKGPFKFRGQAAWRGEPREIRLSTAEAEAGGEVRFKVLVRALRSAASYTLDGRLSDLLGQPRIEGELAARAGLATAAGTGAGAPASAGRAGGGEADQLDLRAKLRGDSLGVALSDIAIGFDQGGQPQLIAGDSEVSWRDGLRLRLNLSSRWLDLDRLSGQAAGAGTAEAVRTLVPSLVALLPESGQVDARLAVDQINLGGEVASGIRVHLERFRGPMYLRELHAALPGGARLDLTGALAVGAETSFTGDVALRGASLARFLGWAARGQTLVDTRSDGAFAMQGRLALDGSGFELAGVNGELAAAPPVAGRIAYRWAERRRLEVQLEGQRIDISPVLSGALELARVKAVLLPGAAATRAAAPPPAWLDARQADSAIRIKTAELADGQRVLRDVDATLAVEQGRLQIDRLRLTTPDGLRLDVEGAVSDLAGTPRGTLSGDLTATDIAALDGTLKALGLLPPDQAPARTQRLERLLPARLAGSLSLGQRAATSTDIALDGLVRGRRLVARIELEAGLDAWRDGAVEASARIDDADAALALAELLGGGQGLQPAPRATLGNGQLTMKAVGRPRAGMVATAALRGAGLSISYDGRIVESPAGGRDLNGVVRLEAVRAEPVLSLLGLGGVAGLDQLGLSGAVEIASAGGTLRLKPRGLRLAGSELTGLIALARQPEQPGSPVSVDAVVTVASASVAGLVSPLLAVRQPEAASPAAGRGPWSEAAFDLASLERMQGRIKLAMGQLDLEPGLALADAALDVELAPGQVRIANLEGRMLGGELKARLVVERAPHAGVAVAGALRIDEARLESLAGREAASGVVGALLQFSGRGISPQALITVMEGKGEVTLGAGQLNRMSPSAIGQVVAAVLDGKLEPAGDGLRKALRDALAARSVRLAPTRLALSIGDGSLRIDRLAFETEDGKGSLDVAVDLAQLKADAEWRLEPKTRQPQPAGAPPHVAGKGLAPAIGIVHVGPLRDIAGVEPRIAADALERVLTVWRMERDVEELERLRREDEERQRREAERQRALEEERQRARDGAQPAQALPGPVLPGPAAAVPPPAAGAAPARAPTLVVPLPVPLPRPAERRLEPGQPAPAGAAPQGGAMQPLSSGKAIPRPEGPAPAAAPSITGTTTEAVGGGIAGPAVAGPAVVGTGAAAIVPGGAATATAPGAAGEAQPLDFPKRPARLGPPRPANPQRPPAFNPFGGPNFGTN